MRVIDSAGASLGLRKPPGQFRLPHAGQLFRTFVAYAAIAVFGMGAHAQSEAGADLTPPSVPGVAPSALWSYGEDDGPAHWSALSPGFAVCGVGSEQSPIDIRTENAAEALLPPVEILWDLFVPEVVDTGRTILVRTGGKGGVARLNGVEYSFLHFLFHHRSEHLIDGKRADMEVQFVHQSAAGDFLIVAGLIEPGDSNPLLEELWPLVPKKLNHKRGQFRWIRAGCCRFRPPSTAMRGL